MQNTMELKAWVRGSYRCIYTFCVALAIMGLAALIPGFILFAKNEIPFSYAEKDETIMFAMGAGLIILGILCFIWSAVLVGCTSCLKNVYEDEKDGNHSEWTLFIRRSRICTATAFILLTLSGLAAMMTGTYFVVRNPLGFVNYGSESNDVIMRAANYAGGLILTRLAVIFFIWSVALAIFAFYVKRASMSDLDVSQSNLEIWLRGVCKGTLTICILLAVMGVMAQCFSMSVDDKKFYWETYATTKFAAGVGLIAFGIPFFLWSAMLMGFSICLNKVQAEEVSRTSFVRRSRICTMITSIMMALAGVAIVATGIVFVIKNPLPFVDNGFGSKFTSRADMENYYKPVMDHFGRLMLFVLGGIFTLWSGILYAFACYLNRKIERQPMKESKTLDPFLKTIYA